MATYADLGNDELFPSWNDLPFATDKHYCFLAEIQQCDGFLRYRTIVEDHEGEKVVVAFYPDSYDDGFDFKQLKRGRTLAIMNAYQHEFLDGSHGVRAENMDDVCVRPMLHADVRANLGEAQELTDSGPGVPHRLGGTART